MTNMELHREPRRQLRHTSTVPFFFSQLKLFTSLKPGTKNVRVLGGDVWGFPLLLLPQLAKRLRRSMRLVLGVATARATEAPNELELTKVPILPEPPLSKSKRNRIWACILPTPKPPKVRRTGDARHQRKVRRVSEPKAVCRT
jgi:hypothetical protein